MSDARSLCFVDTETTSLAPDREVWEVAIIRRDTDGTEKEHCWLIEHDQANADPFALNVGGYWTRFPWNGTVTPTRPVLEAAGAAKAVQFFTHDAVIVGAVPSFDTHVLDRLLRGHGLLPTWHYQVVDVENLASGWLAARGELWVPPCDSDALSRACGVEPPGEGVRHTALGDARWARDLYDAVMGGGK